MTTIVQAPAKINLDLQVLGRRPDGFHEIRTVLQSIALSDTLTLRQRIGRMTIRSRASGVPADGGNLIWVAARELWSALGRPGEPRDVAVTIRKRIPMAGGLGGGSSDAAGALRALRELWGAPHDRRWLRRVASRVGSDVPYFLEGGTALGYGRGERIRRLADVERWWVVLAQAPFGVMTADAYRWVDAVSRRTRHRDRRIPLPRGWRTDPASLCNDLQSVVADHYPGIRSMVDRLQRAGASHASMTGSGSSVFGLFRDRGVAAAARLAVRQGGWRTQLTRTITRAEFSRTTKSVVLE